MTQLASISNNHIALMCGCGHWKNVPVVDLIATHGREITVKEVVSRARCVECGKKGNLEYRIIYVGSSAEAMLGTGVRPKRSEPKE